MYSIIVKCRTNKLPVSPFYKDRGGLVGRVVVLALVLVLTGGVGGEARGAIMRNMGHVWTVWSHQSSILNSQLFF